MKSIFSLLFACLLATPLFAQTNVSVFSEKGERFWVTINGIKQNNKASSNVKVTNLNGSYWKMRVIFENQNIPEVSQNVGTMELNQELTYQVKQNRKGEYVVRTFSIAPINQSTNNAEVTIPYHATETPDSPNTDANPNININVNDNKKPNENGFSLNVNENGFNMNVNVGENGNTNTRTEERTTTTTTTTWNTNTTTNNNNSNNRPANNCWQAMSGYDFANAKNLVKKESFEDTKMKIAQQFTSRNCLSLSQVKEIAMLFTFEENKFEFAKYAYDYCLEKNNYYQLNDIFTFSATKDDFNEFLNGK